jgi:hypothetical protein
MYEPVLERRCICAFAFALVLPVVAALSPLTEHLALPVLEAILAFADCATAMLAAIPEALIVVALRWLGGIVDICSLFLQVSSAGLEGTSRIEYSAWCVGGCVYGETGRGACVTVWLGATHCTVESTRSGIKRC